MTRMKISLFIVVAVLLQAAPVIEDLASDILGVYPIAPQVRRFVVDAQTMSNVSITGRFAVTEGNPKNIEVYVFNEENFKKWRNEDRAIRATAMPLYASGRVAQGNLNVRLAEPGIYYLVMSNMFAYEGKKTFDTDIKLRYNKR